MPLTLDGTNGITQSGSSKANAYLDAAGGNTATVNGAVPATAASPALTGIPTAPTATAATSTTQIATTAFATTADNLKANIASPALTGTPTAPTASLATNTTQIATTAFVLANGGTGLTLLGTIATTSGSSVTLSSLTLTSYKQLQFFFENVSGTGTAQSALRLNGCPIGYTNVNGATDYSTGGGLIDLATGVFFCGFLYVYVEDPGGRGAGGGGPSGLTTASTSVTFTTQHGTFDAGSIKIYGVK